MQSIDQEKLKNLLLELERLKMTEKGGPIAGILFDLLNKVQGIKGDPGAVPQKGIDYWTPEELEHIVQVITMSVQSGIRIPKDGVNGKEGMPGPVGPAGPAGPQGNDGNDGSPDSPEDIKTKLESLKGDKRLDKSAINGLEDFVDKKVQENKIVFMGSGYSGVKEIKAGSGIQATRDENNVVTLQTSFGSPQAENPATGAIDGLNNIFTFAHTPLFIVLNGFIQSPGDDYTLAGLTVTFVLPPPSGSILKNFHA